MTERELNHLEFQFQHADADNPILPLIAEVRRLRNICRQNGYEIGPVTAGSETRINAAEL